MGEYDQEGGIQDPRDRAVQRLTIIVVVLALLLGSLSLYTFLSDDDLREATDRIERRIKRDNREERKQERKQKEQRDERRQDGQLKGEVKNNERQKTVTARQNPDGSIDIIDGPADNPSSPPSGNPPSNEPPVVEPPPNTPPPPENPPPPDEPLIDLPNIDLPDVHVPKPSDIIPNPKIEAGPIKVDPNLP